MPNSAGVVGPDYLIPQELSFTGADTDDLAQALVNLRILNDTSETLSPAEGTVFSPDYLTPIDADLTSVVSVGTLITALESAGIIDDDGGGLSVVGPDYLTWQNPATTDLAGLLGALADAGYVTDTD